jgi:23S rRNA pseudouridine955/2504/2580 synthase
VKHIIEAGLTKAPTKPNLQAENANNLTKPELISAVKAEFVTVDENSDGQRLDNFLIRQLKGVPKTHVYRIIRSGEVRVNKGRASADTRIAEGDIVRLPPVRVSERMAEKTEAMANEVAKLALTHSTDGRTISKTSILKDFPILLEDEHVLAISKPAGVAVHGGSGISFGVIEQLRMARPQAKFLELVHRLDRETSGILLVAKKRSALTNLQNQFRERETGKTYLALVVGAWPANKKVLDKPLHKYLLPTKDGTNMGKEGERRVKVTTKDDPEGMKSVTLVKIRQTLTVRPELVEGWGKSSTGSDRTGIFTLLEVTIKTGRTHQIRVHLASEGHPIAGDDKYGDFELNKALQKPSKLQTITLKRMFLHAWRLQLTHPSTEERVELQTELPVELQNFVDSLN